MRQISIQISDETARQIAHLADKWGLPEIRHNTRVITVAIERAYQESEMLNLSGKYILQNVGRPYATAIPEGAWEKLSEHASMKAAWRKLRSEQRHLSPGSWDDHYRIIAPDGHICDPVWEGDELVDYAGR